MTIDEILQGIDVIKAQAEWEYPMDWQIVLDNAKGIMRKYQKIEWIIRKYDVTWEFHHMKPTIDEIREVLEDGNE